MSDHMPVQESSKPEEALNLAVSVDPTAVGDHLSSLVRGTVEETLNAFLDAEADALCGAKRYERSPDRVDTRAGHYSRDLETKAGKVKLQVPKLRTRPFETQIIERYRRRESSVEEALVEMYLAGVSVRRVEDITEALWGSRVSASTVSDLNKKVYAHIEEWRNLPIRGTHPYVYLDGIWLKRSWGGEVKNIAVLVAIGVNHDGHREVLGVAEGMKEDGESWLSFLRWLKSRGLDGTQLFTTDKCLGLVDALGQVFPQAAWQRCTVHFYRNVIGSVTRKHRGTVADMLKAIHASEDRESAHQKIDQVAAKLEAMKLPKAANRVRDGAQETLSYYSFPRSHWRRIRTNNPIERVNKEIRRRTKVVGAFPDGNSALMLVAARLRHIASTHWGSRRYLDMTPLLEPQETCML